MAASPPVDPFARVNPFKSEAKVEHYDHVDLAAIPAAANVKHENVKVDNDEQPAEISAGLQTQLAMPPQVQSNPTANRRRNRRRTRGGARARAQATAGNNANQNHNSNNFVRVYRQMQGGQVLFICQYRPQAGHVSVHIKAPAIPPGGLICGALKNMFGRYRSAGVHIHPAQRITNDFLSRVQGPRYTFNNYNGNNNVEIHVDIPVTVLPQQNANTPAAPAAPARPDRAQQLENDMEGLEETMGQLETQYYYAGRRGSVQDMERIGIEMISVAHQISHVEEQMGRASWH